MRRSALFAGHALVLGLLVSCADPPPPRRTQPRRPADKAALYGDAALLPTRAGERARAEVALAGELRAAIETLHGVERARVTVVIADEVAHSAAVVVRARIATDVAEVRESTTRIARASLGANAELTVEVTSPQESTPAEKDPAPRRPFVLLAVLGLGFSLGLAFDRTRRMVRRRS